MRAGKRRRRRVDRSASLPLQHPQITPTKAHHPLSTHTATHTYIRPYNDSTPASPHTHAHLAVPVLPALRGRNPGNHLQDGDGRDGRPDQRGLLSVHGPEHVHLTLGRGLRVQAVVGGK